MIQPPRRGEVDRDATLELRPQAPPSALFLAAEDRPPIALGGRRALLVGSIAGADLLVEDPAVSARHARIVGDGSAWRIEDLGSTNGTYVDEVRIREAWLRPNATLRIGRWRARVVDASTAGGLGVRSRADDAAPPDERRRRPELDADAPSTPADARSDGPALGRRTHGGVAPRSLGDAGGPDEIDALSIAGMRGRSPAFHRLLETLRRFAPLPTPVLLRGPTGTGKELAARAIHEWSPRAGGPFVPVNCGALPEGLAESELFGHVRGAFTGAARNHDGAFLRARGGTLFLDEIGELPLHLQATLLRALETRRVSPVGGEQEVATDVRVVAATHRPLDQWIVDGRFREDLYHRIGVLTVDLPPLAERRGDVRLLLLGFGRSIAAELGRPVTLTEEAIVAAEIHPWPGNIRQLRNALLRAAAVSDGPITADVLLPAPPTTPAAIPAISVPRGSYAAMNQALLAEVLRETGSIRKAAKALGIPRSTLGAWLRRGGDGSDGEL